MARRAVAEPCSTAQSNTLNAAINRQRALVKTYRFHGNVDGTFSKRFERYDCLECIFPAVVDTQYLFSERDCRR